LGTVKTGARFVLLADENIVTFLRLLTEWQVQNGGEVTPNDMQEFQVLKFVLNLDDLRPVNSVRTERGIMVIDALDKLANLAFEDDEFIKQDAEGLVSLAKKREKVGFGINRLLQCVHTANLDGLLQTARIGGAAPRGLNLERLFPPLAAVVPISKLADGVIAHLPAKMEELVRRVKAEVLAFFSEGDDQGREFRRKMGFVDEESDLIKSGSPFLWLRAVAELEEWGKSACRRFAALCQALGPKEA
jgi:hypothetical protein